MNKIVKRELIFIGCMMSALVASAQSFKAGNLIIMRYGDGAAPLTYKPAAVFLDEYSVEKSSAPVKTIAVPTVSSGSNYRISGIPKQGTGITPEGLITLSQDKKYITFCGYDAEPGTSVKDVNRIIGRMDASGKINTSTVVEPSVTSQIRCAVASGDRFYFTGVAAGVRLTELGATSSLIVVSEPNSNRSVSISDNQLYASAPGSPAKIFKVGSGVPTDEANRATFLPIAGTATAINQFVLLDADPAIPGPDLLYAVNEDPAPEKTALVKYAFNGSRWVEKGSISIPGVTDNLKSITGTVNSELVTIYAVTAGNELSSSPSALLKIKDQKTSDLTNEGSKPEILATAPANTMFRSVAFAPEKK